MPGAADPQLAADRSTRIRRRRQPDKRPTSRPLRNARHANALLASPQALWSIPCRRCSCVTWRATAAATAAHVCSSAWICRVRNATCAHAVVSRGWSPAGSGVPCGPDLR